MSEQNNAITVDLSAFKIDLGDVPPSLSKSFEEGQKKQREEDLERAKLLASELIRQFQKTMYEIGVRKIILTPVHDTDPYVADQNEIDGTQHAYHIRVDFDLIHPVNPSLEEYRKAVLGLNSIMTLALHRMPYLADGKYTQDKREENRNRLFGIVEASICPIMAAFDNSRPPAYYVRFKPSAPLR